MAINTLSIRTSQLLWNEDGTRGTAEMSELRLPPGQKPEAMLVRSYLGHPADEQFLPLVREQRNADGDLELVEYANDKYSVIVFND